MLVIVKSSPNPLAVDNGNSLAGQIPSLKMLNIIIVVSERPLGFDTRIGKKGKEEKVASFPEDFPKNTQGT